MITEVLGDITPSALVNDVISPEESVRKDDLRDSAFNVIYEHIRKVENGKGPNWVPLKTGLNRTKCRNWTETRNEKQNCLSIT